MHIKKNLKKLTIASLAVSTLNFTPAMYSFDYYVSSPLASVAYAEVRTYEGIGSFLVVNETLESAKEQAKLNAERHIAEEVCAELQSDTESEDGKLTKDEIILMTEGVMKIIDVKYQLDSNENGNIIVRATVTAEVDTEEVEKLLGENSK